MSYQEKRTVATMISALAVMVAYCIHVIPLWQAGTIDPNDLRFWGGTLLIFLGVLIVLAIIIQIVFHILLSIAIAVRERERDQAMIEQTIEAAMVEDEMGKLIELKSGCVSGSPPWPWGSSPAWSPSRWAAPPG